VIIFIMTQPQSPLDSPEFTQMACARLLETKLGRYIHVFSIRHSILVAKTRVWLGN
jgi:hypothetical protein